MFALPSRPVHATASQELRHLDICPLCHHAQRTRLEKGNFSCGLMDCHMVAAVYDTQKQWPCNTAKTLQRH